MIVRMPHRVVLLSKPKHSTPPHTSAHEIPMLVRLFLWPDGGQFEEAVIHRINFHFVLAGVAGAAVLGFGVHLSSPVQCLESPSG